MAVDEVGVEVVVETAAAEANTQRLAAAVEELDKGLKNTQSDMSHMASVFESAMEMIASSMNKGTRAAASFEEMLKKVGTSFHTFNPSVGGFRTTTNQFDEMLRRVGAPVGVQAWQPSIGPWQGPKQWQPGVGMWQGPIPIHDQITTGAWQGPIQWQPKVGMRQGPVPIHDQITTGMWQGPIPIHDQITTGAWQGPIQQQGGGGGLFGGVGAAVWKFAAMLYTIERLGRGIARLAEIVEMAAEKHEADLATLREAGVAEAQLEDTRSQVRGRAATLGISGDDFFKAYQKTLNMKFKLGEDPEGVLRSRNELTAGAFVLAGGHGKAAEQRAELMLSELARASQLGDSGRKAGFQNLRGFPGGPVGFLEKYGHYNEAQARDIVAPTKDLKVWQSHLEILQRVIEAVAQVHLDEDLPTSVAMLGEAFDELLSNGKAFTSTSSEIKHLSESIKGNGGLNGALLLLDKIIAALTHSVRTLAGSLDVIVSAVRSFGHIKFDDTPVAKFWGLPTGFEKNWDLSAEDYNHLTGQVSSTGPNTVQENTSLQTPDEWRHTVNSLPHQRLSVKGAIHPGTDATILPHPGHGVHHPGSRAHHPAASLPNGTQLSINIPVVVHHTSQGDSPETIGQAVADISVLKLHSALEHLGILTHGGSVGA